MFAVISGLGGGDWSPVHDVCEREALPCLFPNVDAPPPQAEHDFYSTYFSRGVLLEAEVIGGNSEKVRNSGKAVLSAATKAVTTASSSGQWEYWRCS